jgi:hypothetical protein
MPYTIRHDKEANCIMVAVDGQLDLSVLESLALDVAKAIDMHGCRCILNDLRRATLKGVVDSYHMPKAARTSGIDYKCKRALVVKEIPSDFDFLETVFVSRGYRVKMFTCVDDARHWLREE